MNSQQLDFFEKYLKDQKIFLFRAIPKSVVVTSGLQNDKWQLKYLIFFDKPGIAGA
jgi:hypothetical protein